MASDQFKMRAKSHHSKSGHFLTLPLEIRQPIYRLLLVSPGTVDLDEIHNPQYTHSINHSIIFANKQIHNQCLPIIYGENEFETGGPIDDLHLASGALWHFLQQIGSPNCGLIRNFRVTIVQAYGRRYGDLDEHVLSRVECDEMIREMGHAGRLTGIKQLTMCRFYRADYFLMSLDSQPRKRLIEEMRGEIIRAAAVVALRTDLNVLVDVFAGDWFHDVVIDDEEPQVTWGGAKSIMRLVVPDQVRVRSGAQKIEDEELGAWSPSPVFPLGPERLVSLEAELEMAKSE